VLGNGVDAPLPGFEDRAGERVRALIARGEYALYLGRLSWKKGLERALQALRGSDVKLVLCGPDDEDYRPQLEQLAHQLGVQGQVRFEPPVAGEDKWALLRAARFVVLPSHNENFGNTVLEAMAVGRPTIATEGVGAAALLESAGAGLVTEPSAEAFGAAMRALWSDPARCEQLGQAAALAAVPWSWTHIAREMSAHYERILARAKQRAGATLPGRA
jgi:glycosyltransferase involved in cell wall biosynthesis